MSSSSNSADLKVGCYRGARRVITVIDLPFGRGGYVSLYRAFTPRRCLILLIDLGFTDVSLVCPCGITATGDHIY